MRDGPPRYAFLHGDGDSLDHKSFRSQRVVPARLRPAERIVVQGWCPTVGEHAHRCLATCSECLRVASITAPCGRYAKPVPVADAVLMDALHAALALSGCAHAITPVSALESESM